MISSHGKNNSTRIDLLSVMRDRGAENKGAMLRYKDKPFFIEIC